MKFEINQEHWSIVLILEEKGCQGEKAPVVQKEHLALKNGKII